MENSNKRPHPGAQEQEQEQEQQRQPGQGALGWFLLSARPAQLERAFLFPLSHQGLSSLISFGVPLDGVTSTNRACLGIPGPSLHARFHVLFGEARYSTARHGMYGTARYLEKQNWHWC